MPTLERAMKPALTAAGHEGAQQENGTFIKPSSQQEIEFYQAMLDSRCPLLEHTPDFMGTLLPQRTDGKCAVADADAKAAQPLIVLSDELHGYTAPCVLDVKLGSILWDSAASPEKRERLRLVSERTTSGSMNFRIAGMSVYDDATKQRTHYGKEFGRAASPETVVACLAKFFPAIENDCVYGVLKEILERLELIHDAVSQIEVEMHSASILIIYEGDVAALEQRLHNQGLLSAPVTSSPTESGRSDDSSSDISIPPSPVLSVKLIDFAHAKFTNTGRDVDTLTGLSRLRQALLDLAREYA